MNRYNRVYRDPGSPLAPLTPLGTEAFTFDDATPTGEGGRKNTARYGLFGIPTANNLTVPSRRPPPPTKSLSNASFPRRFSKEFMRTRSVFSPTSQSTLYGESSLAGESCIPVDSKLQTKIERQDTRLQQEIRLKQEKSKIKREASMSKSAASKVKSEDTKSPKPSIMHPRYKPGSPVEHPTLSPRVKSLLSRTGNEHLSELFTRQEIDIEVLIQMTLEDLAALGVRGAREIRLALNIIQLAKQFF
ncbi:uncharacterized protein LOC108041017 [Drosophila rhopaloa]|uniref:Uncharacterized protein LOC108041017 n=1 Tax=Drosophila rhopaloa TaxID=1041015 RepID=A0A6P4EGV8_DRORH|nr:uncharacterized protein LOC108041017 [Drosophila rhopaloa]